MRPLRAIARAVQGISVIVTSFDRPRQLTRLLSDLSRQKLGVPFEIIVCDDGSPHSSLVGITRACKLHCANLLTQPDEGFRAARARNMGLRSSHYSVVLFLDDDLRVNDEFLSQHFKLHSRSPRAVLGPRLQYEPDLLDGEIERVRLACTGVKDARETKYGVRFQDRRLNSQMPWKLFYSCNASVPRNLALAIGGFDENFVGYGLEDNEFGYRMWSCGARFFLSRTAAVYEVRPSRPRDPYHLAYGQTAHRSNPFLSYLRNADYFKRKHAHDPRVASVLDQPLRAIARWSNSGSSRFRGYRIRLSHA